MSFLALDESSIARRTVVKLFPTVYNGKRAFACVCGYLLIYSCDSSMHCNDGKQKKRLRKYNPGFKQRLGPIISGQKLQDFTLETPFSVELRG